MAGLFSQPGERRSAGPGTIGTVQMAVAPEATLQPRVRQSAPIVAFGGAVLLSLGVIALAKERADRRLAVRIS